MKTLKRLCVALAIALGSMGAAVGTANAQPAGYEYYGHFRDYEVAARVAAALNSGNDSKYDAGWAETSPHPVTQTFGVYARPRTATNVPTNKAPSFVQHGQLTKGHALDNVRQGSHAVVYTVNLNAGQRYQLDLSSPQGPAFFDGWLRVENAQGGVLASDDDSGEGLNARIVLNAPYTGAYRVVVTSYRAGATGSYTLTIR